MGAHIGKSKRGFMRVLMQRKPALIGSAKPSPCRARRHGYVIEESGGI
jgi:hypothetical protein